MLSTILLVISFILFVLATFGVPGHANFQYTASGLAFLVLSMLVTAKLG